MKIEKINNLFRQLANWILRHRLVVGVLFAVVIAFSLVGAKRIVVRTSFDDYFLSDDPILLKTNEFKSIFGNDYYVAVLVKNKDIFSNRSLTLIRELSNELKDSLSYADKVTSLTDLEFASGTEEAYDHRADCTRANSIGCRGTERNQAQGLQQTLSGKENGIDRWNDDMDHGKAASASLPTVCGRRRATWLPT